MPIASPETYAEMLDRAKAGIYKFGAKALVGTDIVAEAGLMCTMRKLDC